MCESTAQKSALAADQTFGSTLRSSYGTDFGESQGIFQNLNTNLEGIIAAGPSQTGMAPAEEAAQRSQALNAAAAANKNVQAVIGQKGAAGSSVPGVESGVITAERAQAATAVESNLANQQAAITQKNYDIGRQNYDTAVKEEMALPAATFDPTTQAANPANTANTEAGTQANANQAASSSWMGLVGGLASSAAGAASGAISKKLLG